MRPAVAAGREPRGAPAAFVRLTVAGQRSLLTIFPAPSRYGWNVLEQLRVKIGLEISQAFQRKPGPKLLFRERPGSQDRSNVTRGAPLLDYFHRSRDSF